MFRSSPKRYNPPKAWFYLDPLYVHFGNVSAKVPDSYSLTNMAGTQARHFKVHSITAKSSKRVNPRMLQDGLYSLSRDVRWGRQKHNKLHLRDILVTIPRDGATTLRYQPTLLSSHRQISTRGFS